MSCNFEEVFLQRKEKIGWIAAVAWMLWLLTPGVTHLSTGLHYGLLSPTAYIFTAIWVGMDAAYRKMSSFWWVLLFVVSGPIGLTIYLLTRRPMPMVCYQCGYGIDAPTSQCPNCGHQSITGRALAAARSAYAETTDSFSRNSVESSRKSVAYMAGACGIFTLLGFTGLGIPGLLSSLAAAAYWILVAYWVYLDAKWRRMDAMPWAVLTLLTNLIGLATYLVIRTPDPATCPQCCAPLTVGLKHCPYCGVEVDLICPRCQSQVKRGWIFCPACAAQLPGNITAETNDTRSAAGRATVSIRGNVIEAEGGAPLAGAEVKIDSKTLQQSAVTDPVGRFVLTDLEPRPYVLIASAEGYVSQTRTFEPSPAKPAPVNFTLSRRPSGQS